MIDNENSQNYKAVFIQKLNDLSDLLRLPEYDLVDLLSTYRESINGFDENAIDFVAVGFGVVPHDDEHPGGVHLHVECVVDNDDTTDTCWELCIPLIGGVLKIDPHVCRRNFHSG